MLEGGLPLPWAVAAMVLGQALAFAALVVVARPGVDDGLPGQVAMRATFGLLGRARSDVAYRVIAATYWFAAQALTAAFGIQAIVVAMGGGRPPLVPTSLVVAVVQASAGGARLRRHALAPAGRAAVVGRSPQASSSGST